jgi:Na+/H+-dicarboxylate symporter
LLLELAKFKPYSTLKKYLKQFKILLSILLIIFSVILFGDEIPTDFKIFFYTLSNSMRKVLLFLLPMLIFPYMVTSIASMRSNAAYLVLGIIALIAVSNFTSIMIAYITGSIFIPHLGIGQLVNLGINEELSLLIDFNLTNPLNIESTIILSLIVGLLVGFSKHSPAIDSFFEKYLNLSRRFFESVFMPALPIYVLGTILKISHETDFAQLLPIFGKMILTILCIQLTYISFIFFIGSGLKLNKALQAFKNSLDAAIVGFSTMSSVVTMPVTLKAAEKNIKDAKVARITISTTVNCHAIGECISLPFIALTIYFISFGMLPDLSTYIHFAFFVAIAQFGGVAVPGGSIIIVLPFLSSYLNFSDEMTSLIIALSIFTDPIGTANNVLGNSAFAIIIYRIKNLIGKFKKQLTFRTQH